MQSYRLTRAGRAAVAQQAKEVQRLTSVVLGTPQGGDA
jgi:hypothetical protein